MKEHPLLQAIVQVNGLYDKPKTHGLIVDYCGITKDLQKALAIFEEEGIQNLQIQCTDQLPSRREEI